MDDVSISDRGGDMWKSCVDSLSQELPEQQFNTWIRPLVVVVAPDLSKVTVQVGNRFKLDWVRAQYAARIAALFEKVAGRRIPVELALAPREAAARSEKVFRNTDAAEFAEPAAGTAVEEPVITIGWYLSLFFHTAQQCGNVL